MAESEPPATEPGVASESTPNNDAVEPTQTQADADDTAETPAAATATSADAQPDKTPAKPKRRPKVILCPYCGHTQAPRDKCVSCGGLFEPLSRRATQIAMGPWTVRDKAQPFRPGCSYEVLKKMIEAGRIGPTTVLRGPTTRQFWSIARNVPGVAHLLGYCHGCGKHVPKEGLGACPHCATPFKGVRQRNELGLQFPHRRAAEAAQRTLNRLIHGTPAPAPAPGSIPGRSEENAAGESAMGVGLDAAGDSAADLLAAEAAALEQDHAPAPSTIFDDESFGSAAGLDVEFDGETDAESEAGADLIDDVLGDSVAALDNSPVMDQAAAIPARETSVPAPSPKTDPAPPVVTETSVPPAALPPRRDINWLVVALVGLNVLVAVAVIAFVATRGGEG
ncbi:MAG: hypothetical protein AAGL98_02780 [Planctomycetota bacterium]